MCECVHGGSVRVYEVGVCSVGSEGVSVWVCECMSVQECAWWGCGGVRV